MHAPLTFFIVVSGVCCIEAIFPPFVIHTTPANNSRLTFIECYKCIGHAFRKTDPRCQFGCGVWKVYPTNIPTPSSNKIPTKRAFQKSYPFKRMQKAGTNGMLQKVKPFPTFGGKVDSSQGAVGYDSYHENANTGDVKHTTPEEKHISWKIATFVFMALSLAAVSFSILAYRRCRRRPATERSVVSHTNELALVYRA